MIDADPNALQAPLDPAAPAKPKAPAAPAPLPVTPAQPVAPPPVTPPIGAQAAPQQTPDVANTPSPPAAVPLPVAPPVASGPLGNIGPKPITTTENWQNADANGAAWQAQHDAAAANHIASIGPIAGDNGTMSQEAYNTSVGKVLDPATGAWAWPEDITSNQFALQNQVNPDGSTPTQLDGTTGLLKPPSALPVTGSPSSLPLAGPSGADGGNAAALPNAPVDTRGGPDAAYLAAAAAQEKAHPGSVDPSLLSGGGPQALPVAGDPGGAAGFNPNANNPAGVDRLGLAKSNFENFANASDPFFQKSLRDANSAAAGAGQLGSGQLRTSLGDLAYNRDLQLNSAKTGFLNDATNNSIEDAYKNYGIGQQDQNTAFNQSVVQTQLEEALRNGDFSRASQLLSLGNQGNPSDTALQLSSNYGNQAGQAGQAASGLVKNSVADQNGGIPDWLQQLLSGGSGGQSSSGGVDLSALFGGGQPQVRPPTPSGALPTTPLQMPSLTPPPLPVSNSGGYQ